MCLFGALKLYMYMYIYMYITHMLKEFRIRNQSPLTYDEKMMNDLGETLALGHGIQFHSVEYV